MSVRRQRQIAFYAEAPLKKALKARAQQEDTTVQTLVERACYEFMQGNHEKPQWWPVTEAEKRIVTDLLAIWRGEQWYCEEFRHILQSVMRVWEASRIRD